MITKVQSSLKIENPKNLTPGKTGSPSGFAPLEPGLAEFLRDRALRMTSETPGLAGLRGRLLDLDGLEVVFAGSEFHLDELLQRGSESSEADSETYILVQSMCHANSALLWRLLGGGVKIVTGYALSDDGLWRQHSWANRDGHVIETTETRVRYFGFELSQAEAERFAWENLPPELSYAIAISRAKVRPIQPSNSVSSVAPVLVAPTIRSTE